MLSAFALRYLRHSNHIKNKEKAFHQEQQKTLAKQKQLLHISRTPEHAVQLYSLYFENEESFTQARKRKTHPWASDIPSLQHHPHKQCRFSSWRDTEGMCQLILWEGASLDLWSRGTCGKHPLAEELWPLSHLDFLSLSCSHYLGPTESTKEQKRCVRWITWVMEKVNE